MNRSNPLEHPSARLAGALAAILIALGGCGGGDGGAAFPPAAANTPPVAAFTSAASVVAGEPMAFDASATGDADGDALTYSWAFGNGQRGGGKQIATSFADPGDHLVRLTVGDGRGGIASVERTVTVTAGPAAAGNVAATTVVRDSTGALLSGVTVANVADGSSALTGVDGRASVGADRGVRATLRFSKAGFADQIKAFTLPAAAESGYLEVVMTPRMAPATLADAAAGGTLTGRDGARVSFEPGSLVDGAGAPVVGAIEVSITPVDVAANVRAFPGRFEGTRPTGEQGLIESYGTAEFILSQGSAAVQLAPGRKATIEIPIYIGRNRDGSAVKAGDAFPLWSLDERSGTWIEEGSGTVVVAASPSGFALRGEVTHFSWWNHDQFLFPIAKPKPRCLVDTNADGILEDLTGTGHCWHAGTGPEQPTPFAPLSAGGGDRKRILAEPRTDRIPTWVAEDFTPAAGGKVLPIPADMDITFRSYAKNGTLFGTTIVRLGADVEQDVPMLLEPVQDNPGTQAIALPYDQRFAVATRGEVDRFTFVAEAAATYDVVVSRATSSLLGGSVRVLDTGGASIASGGFGANPLAAVVTAQVAGTMAVEVTAGDAAPGSYRIEVTKLASTASQCSRPTTLALPSTGNHPIAANGSLCFDLALAVNDAVEISNASATVARGTIRLFSPSGEQVAIDAYGGAEGGMLLRFGAALSGTYRLQIANNQPLAGTIDGLAVARLPIAGTLDLSNSIAFSEAGSVDNARHFLIKPSGTSHLALKVASDSSNFGATVWPQNQVSFVAAGTSGRIIQVHPAALPVVEMFRQSSSGAWLFTLSARVAETLPLDADVAGVTPGPGDVLLYRVDGNAGQEWSAGISYPSSSGATPGVALYPPVSGQLALQASNRVYALAESGPYTVEVRNNAQGVGGAPFKLRVNTAAPPEPVVPGASIERSVTLALGEVRRYSFAAVQGQVLGLQLASTAVDVEAVIAGGGVYNGFVTLALPATSRHSGARYVQRSEPAMVLLYGTSRLETRATGAVTLALQAPPPIATEPGVAVSAEILPSRLLSLGYTIAAPGKYLVCLGYAGPTGVNGTSAVQGAVWGPSATASNYSGDLGIGGTGTSIESLGDLRAGANTLALLSSLTLPAPLQARLVALPGPDAIGSDGTAAVAGLGACQRRYHRFAGSGGSNYTLRITAQFAGTVRVRREASVPGDFATRTDTINLGATPLALAAGVERLVSFTIPSAAPHGSGNYIVEIDGDADAGGAYSVSLASP